MKHPPNSPKLVEAGFFLFPHMKEALDRQMAATYSLNTAWVGVTTTISKKVFATAFWRRYCGGGVLSVKKMAYSIIIIILRGTSVKNEYLGETKLKTRFMD